MNNNKIYTVNGIFINHLQSKELFTKIYENFTNDTLYYKAVGDLPIEAHKGSTITENGCYCKQNEPCGHQEKDPNTGKDWCNTEGNCDVQYTGANWDFCEKPLTDGGYKCKNGDTCTGTKYNKPICELEEGSSYSWDYCKRPYKGTAEVPDYNRETNQQHCRPGYTPVQSDVDSVERHRCNQNEICLTGKRLKQNKDGDPYDDVGSECIPCESGRYKSENGHGYHPFAFTEDSNNPNYNGSVQGYEFQCKQKKNSCEPGKMLVQSNSNTSNNTCQNCPALSEGKQFSGNECDWECKPGYEQEGDECRTINCNCEDSSDNNKDWCWTKSKHSSCGTISTRGQGHPDYGKYWKNLNCGCAENTCRSDGWCFAIDKDPICGTLSTRGEGHQDYGKYWKNCQAPIVCNENQYESQPQTSNSNRECSALTVCNDNQYESKSPTSNSDRECTALTVCNDNQYQSQSPTSNSNRVCTALTVCNENQYQSKSPTSNSDRECSALTVCNQNQYQSKSPTSNSNRECTALTVCNDNQYESQSPTSNSNRECTPLTVCNQNQYESQSPTSNSNRVCTPLTVCNQNQYQSKSPTSNSNRECTPLTVCNQNQYQSKSPTSNSNRECKRNPSWEMIFFLNEYKGTTVNKVINDFIPPNNKSWYCGQYKWNGIDCNPGWFPGESTLPANGKNFKLDWKINFKDQGSGNTGRPQFYLFNMTRPELNPPKEGYDIYDKERRMTAEGKYWYYTGPVHRQFGANAIRPKQYALLGGSMVLNPLFFKGGDKLVAGASVDYKNGGHQAWSNGAEGMNLHYEEKRNIYDGEKTYTCLLRNKHNPTQYSYCIFDEDANIINVNDIGQFIKTGEKLESDHKLRIIETYLDMSKDMITPLDLFKNTVTSNVEFNSGLPSYLNATDWTNDNNYVVNNFSLQTSSMEPLTINQITINQVIKE